MFQTLRYANTHFNKKLLYRKTGFIYSIKNVRSFTHTGIFAPNFNNGEVILVEFVTDLTCFV